MDRRGFFKALAGTVIAAAVLPEIWIPTKAIFLPPTLGWWQPPLRMREVQQYLINTDSLAMRYDVAWGEKQFSVSFPEEGNPGYPHESIAPNIVAQQRAQAFQIFERLEREHGLHRADQRLLPLPRGFHFARYV